MAKIDFATARRLVVEKWLPACEEDLETSAVLFDDRIEEHEWGWLFYWGPKDSSAVPHDVARWGYRPILVDRMTGNIFEAGTGGLHAAVAKLLWERKHNDPIADQDCLAGVNAKPDFDGDIGKLFDIEVLSPLVQFPFSLRPVTNHIQAIGYGWYVLTGPRLSVVDGMPKEMIRTCLILWAKNISAAILASRSEDSINKCEVEVNELPSIEQFMPTSTGWSYGEILKAGRGKLMESAVYGPSGEFQFKLLRLNTSHLYYPSRARKASDMPVAISLTGSSK